MNKTQTLIIELQKIENLSENDKETILKACEQLAYLWNKVNVWLNK